MARLDAIGSHQLAWARGGESTKSANGWRASRLGCQISAPLIGPTLLDPGGGRVAPGWRQGGGRVEPGGVKEERTWRNSHRLNHFNFAFQAK